MKPGTTIITMAGVLVILAAILLQTQRRPPAPDLPPETPGETGPYVWLVDFDSLITISISLPPLKMEEAWIKREDSYWYFGGPGGGRVDLKRWGGGIPLLLSGPRSGRIITESAAEPDLDRYGFTRPGMTISLGLTDGRILEVLLGDRTPDGQAYYIMLRRGTAIYTVDATWYDVMERLVTDPPHDRG